MREGRDVIQDVGTCGGGLTHHFSFARVYGNHRARPRAKTFDDRNDALQLFLDGHGVRARPRAFAADIEDIGALLDELQAVRNGSRRGRVPAAVRKAVRRHVDDPHDARPIERQTRKARAAGRQLLQDIGGRQRLTAPVPAECVAKNDGAPLRRRRRPRQHIKRRERQAAARKR